MIGQFPQQSLKEKEGRRLAARLLDESMIETWPEQDVFEYLEADGFEWTGVEWNPNGALVCETNIMLPGGSA